MPGRSYSAEKGYRYGFNGKEQDKDINTLTVYDYGFRIYNPALGRFLSVDPFAKSYPFYTPYQFAGNRPIWCIDLDGLEDIPTNGGNYYSIEMLRQQAFRDIRAQEAIKRGERVELNQSYSVISNGVRYPIKRTEILNAGSVGSSISAINQDGNFYETGALGPSGLTTTFEPNTGNVQPQNPANPPINGGNGVNPNPPGNGPVIAPINQQRVRNQNFRRNINFTPSQPTFATPSDAGIVNQVAGNAPNQIINNRPVTTNTNNPDGTTTTTTTTTRTQVRSIVTIDLLTNNNQNSPTGVGNGINLQNARYNTIRQQLINQGVPAGNIRRGVTRFNIPTNQMGGNVNQTNFRVRTTTTSTTNGASVTQ